MKTPYSSEDLFEIIQSGDKLAGLNATFHNLYCNVYKTYYKKWPETVPTYTMEEWATKPTLTLKELVNGGINK
jgi:hypothetical protein